MTRTLLIFLLLMPLACKKRLCPQDHRGDRYMGKTYAWWWENTDRRLLLDSAEFMTLDEVEQMLEGTGVEVLCEPPPDGERAPCWSIRAPEGTCMRETMESLQATVRPRALDLFGYFISIERPSHVECDSCDNSEPEDRSWGLN